MGDAREPVQPALVRDAPGVDRDELCIARLERGWLVAVVGAGEDALDELPARRDARLAAVEEQRQEVLRARLVAGG
jgi:hypothetical protein